MSPSPTSSDMMPSGWKLLRLLSTLPRRYTASTYKKTHIAIFNSPAHCKVKRNSCRCLLPLSYWSFNLNWLRGGVGVEWTALLVCPGYKRHNTSHPHVINCGLIAAVIRTTCAVNVFEFRCVTESIFSIRFMRHFSGVFQVIRPLWWLPRGMKMEHTLILLKRHIG